MKTSLTLKNSAEGHDQWYIRCTRGITGVVGLQADEKIKLEKCTQDLTQEQEESTYVESYCYGNDDGTTLYSVPKGCYGLPCNIYTKIDDNSLTIFSFLVCESHVAGVIAD